MEVDATTQWSLGDASPEKKPAVRLSPKKGVPPAAPQLVGHLPSASAEALSTFEELPECTFQTSKMGRTRAHDDPTCECTLSSGKAFACTEESGCINRLTQVECLAESCACGRHCQNQRCVLLWAGD